MEETRNSEARQGQERDAGRSWAGAEGVTEGKTMRDTEGRRDGRRKRAGGREEKRKGQNVGGVTDEENEKTVKEKV